MFTFICMAVFVLVCILVLVFVSFYLFLNAGQFSCISMLCFSILCVLFVFLVVIEPQMCV